MNDTKRTIELAAGDSALIGGARITLVEKSGKRARIVVQAPSGIPIVHPITNPSCRDLHLKSVRPAFSAFLGQH